MKLTTVEIVRGRGMCLPSRTSPSSELSNQTFMIHSTFLCGNFYQEKTNEWLEVVYGYYIAAKLLSEMQATNSQIMSILLKILNVFTRILSLFLRSKTPSTSSKLSITRDYSFLKQHTCGPAVEYKFMAEKCRV